MMRAFSTSSLPYGVAISWSWPDATPEAYRAGLAQALEAAAAFRDRLAAACPLAFLGIAEPPYTAREGVILTALMRRRGSSYPITPGVWFRV